jgi:hypothetical protein
MSEGQLCFSSARPLIGCGLIEQNSSSAKKALADTLASGTLHAKVLDDWRAMRRLLGPDGARYASRWMPSLMRSPKPQLCDDP